MITKKINVRDVAIGAGGLAVLLCVPVVGSAIAKMLGTVRDKIGGRK